MGLSAWERQALDSIKSGVAGSDPELAALLSAFSRLESGEEMPDWERIPAGLMRLRRFRRRSSLRRACRRLGFGGIALLSSWVVTTAALIVVIVLVLAVGGRHGSTCTETAAMTCVSPASGHSPGSSPRSTAGGQALRQRAADIPQAGP